MKRMAEPAVAVRGLSLRYGGELVVREADLDVERGSLTALVGPSGCGKTTLLRAVAGFERPVAGSIAIGGERVANPDRMLPPERRRVAMVFQDGALFPHLTVGENVRYGVRRRPDGGRRARRTLELVGLEELADRYPDELSGGQQRRVALARALAPEPRLVLLDEPFAALDAALRERVRVQVRSVLAAAGATAVLVTHDQEEALSVADRVAVMSAGRILQTGPPQEVYRLPATLAVAEILGGGQLVDGTVRSGRCHTVFGRAACRAADGPGLLFVRPEDLLQLAPEAGEGVPATVAERRFFGHDVLDRVRLQSGDSYQTRVPATRLVPLGSRVRLALRGGEFPVFPLDSTNDR